ncbi:MAG: amino acid permease [Epsilonproteobacteria bacterium]|nr:amino acid permease [Campylobacterota bacterium]
MKQKKKAFGVIDAAMLGIGSMVGAGIFIVIGQAGAIAGNLVWVSFLIGGIAALLSGYSLSKLAIRFPSRGGIVEYLVQGFGEGIFSGAAGILFYLSQLVAIAAVAKSFGTYAATFLPGSVNLYALGVVAFFTLVNLIGAAWVAKSENVIVGIKITVLLLFTAVALWHIDPTYLSVSRMPPVSAIFYAVGLTFFAYQGFSVITNTVEEMEDPSKTMPKAMTLAILFVAALYILTSLAVLGNLPLSRVMEAKDYALAEAAKPIFGALGFKIMAATALLATASAINATLYAATEIGYTMAKEGNLPKIYEYNLFRSFEGLIVSALSIVPMILFFNLSQITTVAALTVLVIQGVTHVGHLRRIRDTGAHPVPVTLAAAAMFAVTLLTLYHTHSLAMGAYLLGALFLAVFVEAALRFVTKRHIRRQSTR